MGDQVMKIEMYPLSAVKDYDGPTVDGVGRESWTFSVECGHEGHVPTAVICSDARTIREVAAVVQHTLNVNLPCLDGLQISYYSNMDADEIASVPFEEIGGE
jgi:hypothetical protein